MLLSIRAEAWGNPTIDNPNRTKGGGDSFTDEN
jgi:hypothetical protein